MEGSGGEPAAHGRLNESARATILLESGAEANGIGAANRD
jgi:hypothetical protein